MLDFEFEKAKNRSIFKNLQSHSDSETITRPHAMRRFSYRGTIATLELANVTQQLFLDSIKQRTKERVALNTPLTPPSSRT